MLLKIQADFLEAKIRRELAKPALKVVAPGVGGLVLDLLSIVRGLCVEVESLKGAKDGKEENGAG